MASITKHHVLIKDLSTRSVTLYPNYARVVRDIPSLALTPGANQVEILGLAPTVDEKSVQIEGHGGGASITDMSVELIPNRDIFQEAYPESEEEVEESDSDESGDDDTTVVDAIKADIKSLEAQSTEASERQRTANRRLEILDDYVKAAVKKATMSGEQVTDLLAKYEVERLEQFTAHTKASEDLARICQEIEKKDRELWKASKGIRKQQREKKIKRNQAFQAKQRQKAERAKEKERIKAERLKFWPKKLYRVTLGLDVPVDTPASSRRSSITNSQSTAAEETNTIQEPESREIQVALALSYVTKEAFWSPQHDISISSVKKTATIRYHAEFANKTSETWKDAKVTLCSSQTSFSGLHDHVPELHPWQIRLAKENDTKTPNIESRQETYRSRYQPSTATSLNRSALFGVDSSDVTAEKPHKIHGRKAVDLQSKLFQPWGQRTDYLEGASSDEEYVNRRRRGGAAASRFLRLEAEKEEEEEASDEDMGFGLFDDGPSVPVAKVAYEQSEWEDNGLTSTYELPGIRTLEPSSIGRRYNIATLHAADVELSHAAVPKLRASAYLHVSLKNPSSSVTLLPGPLSITLDASFLGSTKLPRMAPNQTLQLSLGVDPSVHVTYSRNTPRRTTAGILFTKETAVRMCREIWLRNTRDAAITMSVSDQVPESQDERLKVDLLQPAGLQAEGRSVSAGTAASSSGRLASARQKGPEGQWGKATATMQKDGRVVWNVSLDKGAAALLTLEYEVRLPAQEEIANAS